MDTATALDLVRPYAMARAARDEQQLQTVEMHLSLVSHTFCVPPAYSRRRE
jgi:hypothetical protein